MLPSPERLEARRGTGSLGTPDQSNGGLRQSPRDLVVKLSRCALVLERRARVEGDEGVNETSVSECRFKAHRAAQRFEGAGDLARKRSMRRAQHGFDGQCAAQEGWLGEAYRTGMDERPASV